jgi:hypothetical protein
MTFRDAKAIAEAVQRPTMKFVAIKTADHPIVHRLIIAGIDKAWTSDGQRPKNLRLDHTAGPLATR